MRWASKFALFVSCLLTAGQAHAQSPSTDAGVLRWMRPEREPGDTEVYLRSLIGAANAPFFVPEFPEVTGQVWLLQPGAMRRVAGSVWLGAVVPLAFTSVRQPAGSYVDEAAWGNPALVAEFRDDGAASAAVGWFSVARASFGLPLAERGPRASQMVNRALALSDALQALREPSFYTPGVASLTLDYRIGFAARRWLFGPGLSVPLLVRVDGAELPAAQTRAIGLRPRAELWAAYFPSHWFGMAMHGSLALDAIRVADPIRREDARHRLQPSLRPEVIFATTPVAFVLSCLVSIGGPAHESVGCGAEAVLRF